MMIGGEMPAFGGAHSPFVASLKILDWPKNFYAKVFDKTRQGLA